MKGPLATESASTLKYSILDIILILIIIPFNRMQVIKRISEFFKTAPGKVP
jgi:hypothetical protein